MTTQETRHGPQSVRGPRINKGLVIVNTGNGKGKTTAAMGVLMRSWGRDMKVIMLQFIKHTTANFGEQRAAQKMGVSVRAMGDGFTWRSQGSGSQRRPGPRPVGRRQGSHCFRRTRPGYPGRVHLSNALWLAACRGCD